MIPPTAEALYDSLEPSPVAADHVGFINSLSVDNLSQRFLLAGAADSSITIWDVDSFAEKRATNFVGPHEKSAEPSEPSGETPSEESKPIKTGIEPVAKVARQQGHKFGVSKAQWWPFDNGMFASGSFDATVKLWDADSMTPVYTFAMEHKVYTLDINRLDERGLVAVGLDLPFAKLLDLRAGSAVQELRSHSGKILSTKWNPVVPHLLATAGSDGSVRLWDIRQASTCVESMDMMRTDPAQPLNPLDYRRAHRASVNGLVWFPGGDRLVSLGNDNKARVWRIEDGGINEAVNFGPLVQNRHLQNLDPCLSPAGDLPFPYLFVPSDAGYILMLGALDGLLVKRLEPPGGATAPRTSAIVARGEGTFQYYSGDGAGAIVEWSPPPQDVAEAEAEEFPESVTRLGDYIDF